MKTGDGCGAQASRETGAHLPKGRGWRGRQSSCRSHPRCLTGLLLRRRPRGRGDRRLRLLLLLRRSLLPGRRSLLPGRRSLLPGRRSLLPGRRSLLLRRRSRLLQRREALRLGLVSLLLQCFAALPAATTPLPTPAVVGFIEAW